MKFSILFLLFGLNMTLRNYEVSSLKNEEFSTTCSIITLYNIIKKWTTKDKQKNVKIENRHRN